MHRIHDLLILMRTGHREHFRMRLFDHVRFGAETAGDDHFAIGFNRFANRIQAFFAGAVEEAARIDQDQVGAGIVRADLIAFGAQAGSRCARNRPGLLGQPSETIPTLGMAFGLIGAGRSRVVVMAALLYAVGAFEKERGSWVRMRGIQI